MDLDFEQRRGGRGMTVIMEVTQIEYWGGLRLIGDHCDLHCQISQSVHASHFA
jgi:hypothetical protein